MELRNTFAIPVPVDEAWKVLLDVERIAPCMPGAKLLSSSDDVFEGSMRVKLGPMTLTYKGTAQIIELDEADYRAVLEASGKEARGAGTARAKVTMRLLERGDDETEVDVLTNFSITGKPAQFGRGVMADVAERLVDRFAARLAEEITGPAAAASDTGTEPEARQPVAEQARVAGAPQDEEALSLFEIAGGPVAKRLVPALAALVAVVLVVAFLRRRKRT